MDIGCSKLIATATCSNFYNHTDTTHPQGMSAFTLAKWHELLLCEYLDSALKEIELVHRVQKVGETLFEI